MPQPGSTTKGAARRGEILDAAWNHLSNEGYSGASLREISRSMGMESAHVLYYFESRERLLMAVLERWDEACWHHAEESTDGDRIEVFIRAVQRNNEFPGIVQLYLAFTVEAADANHPAHEYLRQRFDRVRAELNAAVARRCADGRIASHVDPDSLAQRLIAIADGLQLQALLSSDADIAAQLRSAVDEVSLPQATHA